MNNITRNIAKFFKNKNTVTILGVIAIVAIIYFGYTYTINSQVQPTRVPVATKTIQPRTQITADMITWIDVPGKVSESAVKAESNIVGKYTDYNTVIPEGSMFYESVLIEAKELPDSAFVDIEVGQVPYQFSVDMESTYGNSIFPGNQIDLYMKATNDKGQIMVGRFLENVKVLAVKDSDGQHVFENTEEKRTPAYIIFGLDYDISILLLKAKYLSDVEVFPVPHGTKITEGQILEEGQIQVSSQELKSYIQERTVVLPEELLQNNTDTEVTE